MKAKYIKENIEDVLKPKSDDEIQKSLWKGPGFYSIVMAFDDSISIEFKSAKTPDELYEFYEIYKDKYLDPETFDLIKIYTDHKMPFGIDYRVNHAPEFYGKSNGGIDHILRLI